jgi:hypothetical protein
MRFALIFKLGLLLLVVLMSGMEVVAEEYSIVLDSLTVFEADEFAAGWTLNKNSQRREGRCKSAFGVKIINSDNKSIFTVAKCNQKLLSAKTPLVILIDKEIQVDTATVVVKMYEVDSNAYDRLSFFQEGKTFLGAEINLEQSKGKSFSPVFKGEGGWGDGCWSGPSCSGYPIKVELKLHIKQDLITHIEPELFELQPKFISQIKRHIPVAEQTKFIKDYVRPHTTVNVKDLNGKEITGTTTSQPIYKTNPDNKIVVPPYLKWQTTASARASLRFPNQAPIENLKGDEGIALPILQWLADNKKGVLVFATDEPNELFSLSKLDYNRSDDYNLPKDQTQQPVVAITLPKEIADQETLKTLISHQNSLTIRYKVNGVPLSKTIKASDVGTTNGGIEVSLPFGKYEPTDVTITGAGIFSFFDFISKPGESLSFDTRLKTTIGKETAYPSNYAHKKECEPLAPFSTSQLIEKLISSQIAPESAKGIKINCPYLITTTLNPQPIDGNIVLYLTKVETLQVKFMLKDEVAKDWWVIPKTGESKQLSSFGQIDLAELPLADLTLAPPPQILCGLKFR